MTSNAIMRSLWAYRGFIFGSVKREFRSTYGNALLGSAWTILNPLAMILVYTIILSQVMRSKLPEIDTSFAYSIYLCAGILSWNLFAEISARGQTMFLDNANIIKKINFPRICLPVIVVLTASLNFAISFGLFTGFLIFSGSFPGWAFLAIFPVLLLQVTFAIGFAILLGVLNVFFRDVGQFFSILMQFWFWFTPIVYPVSILPESIRALLPYNPMAQIVAAYQTILVYGRLPAWQSLVPAFLLSLLLCLLGLQFLRKRAGEMVDEL